MEDGSAEDRLRESEERHRLLAEHANDVVWTMSPAGEVTYISPAIEAMRGFTPEEAMDHRLDQTLTPESQVISAAWSNRLATALEEGTHPEDFRGELEYLCKDGTTVWTDVQVIPHIGESGEVIEILGVSRDISERKRHEAEIAEARREIEAANEALARANERLRRQALTDDLTGLYNRRHAKDLLDGAADGKGAAGSQSSLLMIDIDDFKQINDNLGHLAGDRVLIELSQRIAGRIRGTDVLIRWGGDEFVVLMPLCDLDGASKVAEEIRHAVASEPFPAAVTAATVSIGVSQAAEGEDFERWVGRADTALLRAKNMGRDRVEVERAGSSA
jgi:diguanylate cyclase (GGDEF)-like protein/PAS domain S-box-containing protein